MSPHHKVLLGISLSVNLILNLTLNLTLTLTHLKVLLIPILMHHMPQRRVFMYISTRWRIMGDRAHTEIAIFEVSHDACPNIWTFRDPFKVAVTVDSY